jgi:hypothetical protein
MGVPEELKPYQYKPGQSGNPSGRPRGLISAALIKQLRKSGGKDLAAIVEGIIRSARRGNPKSFSVIRDSVDGRPLQEVAMDASLDVSLAERLERARKRLTERERVDREPVAPSS